MEPCREEVEEQFIWIPSTAYANLAEAFDEGVKLLGLLVNPEYHIMVTLRDNSASLHDLKPKQCKNE